MNINEFKRFFLNPKIGLTIIILFLIGYIIYSSESGGFGNNFLTFGPTKNAITGEPIYFMGAELTTWKSVLITYIIIFFASLANFYYNEFLMENIFSYLINPAVENIPMNKFWTYLITLTNPLLSMLFYIITFFATATMQLQYILPQILAYLIIRIPFILGRIKTKKFIKN